MTYLLAASIGGLVAFVFSIPAIVFEIMERGHVKNVPLLVDIKTIFGRRLHKEEVFLAALFFYIIIGSAYGAAYVWFVENEWSVIIGTPFTLLSLVVFAVGSWVVLGLVIMPILRMGLFGRKEGRYVWLELLMSMLLVGLGMWVVVQYYQPSFF
ncbi:MAG: hypothetical protein ABIH21_05835 [Patescibacteria group bacterium]